MSIHSYYDFCNPESTGGFVKKFPLYDLQVPGRDVSASDFAYRSTLLANSLGVPMPTTMHRPFRQSHEIYTESFPWLRIWIFAALVTIAALCYAGWDYYRHIPHAGTSDDLNDMFKFPIPAPTVTVDP